jgi:hypothetical protein
MIWNVPSYSLNQNRETKRQFSRTKRGSVATGKIHRHLQAKIFEMSLSEAP